MIVEIVNRQEIFNVDEEKVESFSKTISKLSSIAPHDVTIILVDDKGSEEINNAALGHNGPTDVITITYPAIPGDDEGDSIEIIVNLECAKREGKGRKGTNYEVAYYIAHAFNHLTGLNDVTPEERTAMHRRERRWLSAAAIPEMVSEA